MDSKEMTVMVGELRARFIPIESTSDALMKAIKRKLLEEAAETMCADDESLPGEVGDVLFIAYGLCYQMGMDAGEVLEKTYQKNKERWESGNVRR